MIDKKLAGALVQHNSKLQTLNFVFDKLNDYTLLFKFRLSLTVVFSSVIAWCIAVQEFNITSLFLLFWGGFLITAGANAFNQLLEKDYDKLMKRTQSRPLAAGRMNMPEAILAAGLSGIAGVGILWWFFNPLGALLGAISLLTYAFVYTPLKRLTPFAVLVGAFPGALPPLIGWVCATGTVGFEAFVITSIQFLWQFPHFWAIAWIAHDDYRNAGFKLLPSSGGQDRYTALLSIFYIIILIAVSAIPAISGMIGPVAGAIIFLAGIGFLAQSIRLFRTCAMKDAKSLMMGSIIYLPVVLLALLAGQ
ncbi:MAG TPA: heme o synthase [Chitinophagales bacterium]|nr:heme o synthase [Chitinophagales bacterium]